MPEIEEMVTAEDVDFSAYEKTLYGKEQPKAEPALEPEAKEPATEPAKQPELEVKPQYLTAEDAQRLVDEKLAAAKPKEEPKSDPAPSLADPKFETVEQWQEAYAAWSQRQVEVKLSDILAKREAEQQQAAISQQEIEKRRETWEKREAEAKTRYPEYDQLKEAAKSRPFNETALQFILNSEIGPDLFIHYVKNEQEWNELIALPPEDMRIELRATQREIRRQLETAKAQAEAPKPKTVSSAPPPPRTLTGRSAPAEDPEEKAILDGDFSAYEKQMLRKARDEKGRFV
jgi:hypothetical protein